MKKKTGVFLLILQLALLLTGCGIRAAQTESMDLSNGASREKGEAGELRYQDDYYEYVNKDLLDEIELDASSSHWEWITELDAVVREDMGKLIRELSQSSEDYEEGSSEQKIRDLYECVSDVENRNETGLGPLKPHMDRIRNAGNIPEYVDALAQLSREFGFSSIVGGYAVTQDKADSDRYVVTFLGADTLIGKAYVEGEDTQEYVERYLEYVKDMFCEFGMKEEEAQRAADLVERLLRQICASTLTTEQMYDPAKTYNVYTAEDLQQLYTNVDVDRMLKTLGIYGQEFYVVSDVEQAKKINSLLAEENLEALKDYSTFVMLNDTAAYGAEGFDRLSRQMENTLYGIEEDWDDETRWADLTQKMLPWDFGAIYVEEHFSQEDKEEVEKIIALILEEYEKVILRQEWMSQETKQKAIRKLETMNVKIGYPEQWPQEKDMMRVTPISRGGSLISNMLTSMNVGMQYELSKLEGRVDKAVWDVTPQTVNAFYDPLKNEIVFPAGILQAPFYDRDHSFGANMGGIGYIIAHEVSHAFDSSGAMYDEYGNYHVWWKEEELEEYEKLSQSIVDYYNGYEVMGVKVNGELTLGENIADLGAVACITSIIGDDKEALDEAFGQMAYNWASEDTAEYMLYLLNVDTHSPNKVRVNAVLSSCDAFYEVYEIRETDGMYVAPEDRVGIWR